MSLSATLFGRNSLIFKVTNVLGLGIPGLLDKTFGPGEQPGMALGEISQQTAKEGEPRVIVWGRVRPIGGNLIHVQSPVKRWVKQKSSGGKGGGGSKSQKVEHVYRTYAVGVCEGPITGYARIWRNNKLVYDGRGTEWGRKNNRVFLRSFRLYLGGWNQMPDPALEAIWGAGDVPAYRGTAYMVALDEDLTELGGSVPQWLFEVERAEGLVVTSKPYVLDAGLEAVDVWPDVGTVNFKAQVIDADNGVEDGISFFPASVAELRFRASRFELDAPDEESFVAAKVGELSLSKVLATISAPPEEAEILSDISRFSLRVALVKYEHPAPEESEVTQTVARFNLYEA